MEETGLPLPSARCISKEQAADYLGIGLTLFATLAVPSVRFGRRCVYDKLDLDAWLNEYKEERRRARKENTLWPITKESTKGQIPASGGLQRRSPMEDAYAKALGLKSEPMRKHY